MPWRSPELCLSLPTSSSGVRSLRSARRSALSRLPCCGSPCLRPVACAADILVIDRGTRHPCAACTAAGRLQAGIDRETRHSRPRTHLDTLRSLGCLQIDPVVAPTQALVLWSRLGIYDPAQLDGLAWTRRALFLYWAHAASFVLTEDYPIHQLRMRRRGAGRHCLGTANARLDSTKYEPPPSHTLAVAAQRSLAIT